MNDPIRAGLVGDSPEDAAEFLDGLRSGSPVFFARLVQVLEPGVRQFLREYVACDRDAEDDLVQTTWILMYAKRNQFRGGTPVVPIFQAWVLRLARTVHNRWRRARKLEIPFDLCPEPPAGAVDPLDRIAVEALIARLPPRQRIAAWCRWVEDLTEAETARRMGIRVGAAKKLLAKARARLRFTLGGGGTFWVLEWLIRGKGTCAKRAFRTGTFGGDHFVGQSFSGGVTMKRNKLLLQALVVTLMGLAAHLTRPAPAASASRTSSCELQQSHCTGTCNWTSCNGDCAYACIAPPNDYCELATQWFEACFEES